MKQQSSEFGTEIRAHLTQFKQICRSNLPKLKRSKININDLQIKRRQLRYYSDSELYQVVKSIIQYVQKTTQDNASELYEHKGMTKFTEELQVILDEYIVQNNSVIHRGKYSARIHLNLVQNIKELEENNNPDLERNIIKQIKIIQRLNHVSTIQKIKGLLENIRCNNPNLYKKIVLMTQNNI